MKFVIVSNDIFTVINFRLDLIKSIKCKGYDVYILAPNLAEHPNIVQQLENNGFIVQSIYMDRAGTSPINDFRTIVSIFGKLKKINPDIVFNYTIKPVIYGTIAAHLCGISKIYSLICGLGNSFQEGKNGNNSIVSLILKKLYRFSLDKCACVFFQNKDDLNLLNHFNILKDVNKGVIVNGSGIDLKKFEYEDLKIGIEGKPAQSFIMVARLLKYKGVIEYIEAAKFLKDKYPFAEFHLVGDIDQNPASITKNELSEWENSDFIHCWGKLTDVRPALQQANIFVLPSYYREGIPRSILEAMSMGKAIITTDNVGCRETVENGKNGLLVEVKSVDSLINAMEKLIKNPLLIEEMAIYSRKLAEQKFDVHKVNESMLSNMSI